MKVTAISNGGPALRDPYGRVVNSLRISITQRCNFNCFFCHQEGEHNSKTEITLEDIEVAVSIAAELGVRKIKLTGGEPLIRDDVTEVIHKISPYVEEVSLTTNGSFLQVKSAELREAGLSRVNVSLHSLRPKVFQRICGCDALDEVKRGIISAIDCGLNPVKLNMVVMEGLNDLEVSEMIDFSKSVGAILQLIEFQPLNRGVESWEWFHRGLQSMEQEIEARSRWVDEREMHRRKIYHLKAGGIVEVVKPMHNSEFCRFCTRLRMTSNGDLKPCLMRSDNHVGVAPLLRGETRREDLVDAFEEATARREPFWRK